MKVVISSCDKYSWLVPIFLHFYRKNWPDNPYQTVVVTETKKTEGVDTFCADKNPFTDRMIKYLESINDETFLLFMEEFILNERVNNDEIKRAENLCANDIGCVRLNDHDGTSCFLVDSEIEGFKEYPLDKPYSLSHQASIWQREFFLELLQKGENNWQAEVNGSKRIRRFGKKVIWNDSPTLNYHKCGYMRRRKVVKSEERWVKDNWDGKKKTIPIFIITCDRLKVLQQSIQSYYDNIKTPFEIIIIDLGSTYEPTRKYLRLLQYEGKKIYRENKIIRNSDLNKIDAIIQDYFSSHPASNYVVTDPDIALDNVEGDILNVYSYMLERLPGINVVGPMLRIDDIPDHYPKKQKVISNSLHVDFHSRPVNTIINENKNIKYIFAPIDTTFAMSRAGSQWMRLKRGIRILSPYSAKHLDWYIDPEDLSPDQVYYKEHASKKIAHWSLG